MTSQLEAAQETIRELEERIEAMRKILSEATSYYLDRDNGPAGWWCAGCSGFLSGQCSPATELGHADDCPIEAILNKG